MSDNTKTTGGKAISSRSATRRGFASNKVVLPNESATSYRALNRAYVDHFRPQNILEIDLVAVMALSRWRLRRLVSIETNYLTHEMEYRREDVERYVENPTPDKNMAWIYSRVSTHGALPLVTRQEAALTRTFNGALKQLQTLRAEPKAHIGQRTRKFHESAELTPQS